LISSSETQNILSSELHKLSKLIWQKEKCWDYKWWKYFFTVYDFVIGS